MGWTVEQIGRYRVTGELGRGAMGVVYRAEDPAIGRTVAIKTIRLGELSAPSERERLRERLLREARSAGILSHPGIVTIYDVKEEGDTAYVFMEYVDGQTLERMLRGDAPIEGDKILDVLRQTATALDYAHGKGIVHRDIKPANVMVSVEGEAKITDFGVAKILSQQMTQAGTIMGTPNYMSPEQIQGESVDGRSDQFSLAVIAFELITGEKPYAADSLPTLLYKIVKEPPVSPERLNPTLGTEVGRILERAFSKDPAGRYESCTEFVSAFALAVNASPNWKPQLRGSASEMETVISDQGQTAPPLPQADSPAVSGLAAQTPLATAAERRRARQEEADRESHLVRNVLVAVALAIVIGSGVLGYRYYQELMASQAAVSQLSEAEVPPEAAAVESQNAPPLTGLAPPELSAESPRTEPEAMVVPPEEAVETRADEIAPPEEVEVVTAEPEPAAEQVTEAQPPPAQPPKPPPPALPTEYRVQIRSNPAGARVTADNNPELVCETPCELTFTRGRHTLDLSLAGHRLAPRIINVPDILDVTVNLDRMAGTLAITSEPAGATIILNGETQNEKTPALLRLPVGRYSIRLVLEGRPAFEDTVEVQDQVITNIGVDW